MKLWMARAQGTQGQRDGLEASEGQKTAGVGISQTRTSSQRDSSKLKGGDSVLGRPDSLLALELRAAEWG